MSSLTAKAKNKTLDVEKIRNNFPMINKPINGKQLIYFDSASTNHKPGQLAAQPLMKALKVPALLRASFCYYNTHEEIDIFASAIETFISKNR